MGAEVSRRNSLQPYGESLMPQLMNNQQPLKFHNIHGDNVNILQNSSVASRGDGFCKGIVFSHRPVSVNEYVYIKFLDISSSWSGGLRIGFTANDPVSYKHKLPKYACPCMTDMPGNWARALAERFVQKDSVLFYYVNQKGEVHYGLNNEERGIFFSGVNTSGKLWALMDIYGNTIRIELLPGPIHPRNSSQRIPDELCNNVTNIMTAFRNTSRDLAALEYPNNMVPQKFHEIHGRHAVLHETRTFAVHDGSYLHHGYVFSDLPIALDNFYVIKVTPSEKGCNELVFGITSCNPSTLSIDDLPDHPDLLFDRPEYWIVHKINGRCKSSDFFAFVVTKNGEVKYTINGSPCATALYADHTLDLWIFFCVNKYVWKINLEGSCRANRDSEVLDFLQSLKQSSDEQSRSPSSQGPVEDLRECVICCESDKNTAVYRCGHVCMCFECASQLFKSSNPQCPICRETIVDVLKIYQ